MTLHRALDQASLRDLGTWAFDPVLWSLHWEVLYSVLLPVAVLIALFSRRAAVMAIFLLATALVGVGWGAASANSRAEYLPMFLIGALLAVHWPRITAIVRRASSPTVWGLTIASVFLLTTNYWLRPGWARDVGIRKMLVGTSESAVVLGAATVIVLAIGRNSWGNALQRPSIRWLGSRSYSLYLVHEPLVVSIAFAFRARETTIMLLAIALPAALVLAEVFWRTVERPSIGLAYRLGSLVDRITTIRSRSVRSQGIQELASVD